MPGSNSSQIVIIDDDIVSKIFYFNAQSDTNVQEIINAGLIIRHKLNKIGDKRINTVKFLTVIPTSNTTALLTAEYPIGKTFEYGTWYVGYVFNGNQFQPIFQFELVMQTGITLVSCLNKNVKFNVPTTFSGFKLRVLGNTGELCQVTLNSSVVNVNSSECGINYGEHFDTYLIPSTNETISVFETVENHVIRFTCHKIENTISVSNDDLMSNLDVEKENEYPVKVRASMFLHSFGNESDIINSSVSSGTLVTLRIKIQENYVQDFDLIPKECYVNNILPIIREGCTILPQHLSPVNNFTKLSLPGNYESSFNAFRPLLNGIPVNNLHFTCTLLICYLNQCPPLPTCISTEN